ncbi:SpoIIE family protein phosphatase [Streptomyces chumphonensis]|uniref:protein-serine/threonine phosphatase n=1 Tax=Streptomyces chumphonensis TaxID=1214925 RepID=A0A927F4F7_9ACTN|nr:SpoIIE family protein phosphatase [Streptomyces chumphonensis]MBD3934116.1 SpoIIE family protein phosphatase [Streptomyces chumphonensis]
MAWRTAEDVYIHHVLTGLVAGVTVQDARGRVVAVNRRARELLGRTGREMIGRDAHDLLHRGPAGEPLPRSQCPLMRAFLAGHTEQFDHQWFQRGDGGLLPVAGMIMPYLFAGSREGAAVAFYERASTALGNDPAPPDHVAALADLADRLALVSETTAVLTSTLDLQEGLRRLVRLVVPRLADWAVVDLLSETGSLQRVAVVHMENGRHVEVAELAGPMPPLLETSRRPLSRVLRGATASLFVSRDDYVGPPDSGVAAVQHDLFDLIGMRSAIIAPLPGPRRVHGALTLARTDNPKPYDAAELALVDDISRRAGLAVDNAQLYAGQQRVSETMQRHLLPRPPDVPGLEMECRYRAAPQASRVGGDWYDAFRLPDGATALVIGDILGHDLQAAACMAQVRNMLRAFAWQEADGPSVTVDRLDRSLVHISEAETATLVFARLTPAGPDGGWRLRWTNAGHPPPLLLDGAGGARLLEEGSGLLLGTELPVEREEAAIDLPPRSTLVLYTDGLVEARDLPVDEGLALLTRHAAELAHLPLDAFCDELLRRSRPAAEEDDVALLALRVPPDDGARP